MTVLERERKKLNELIEKHGIQHELVLKQSEIVNKLVVNETKKLNKE